MTEEMALRLLEKDFLIPVLITLGIVLCTAIKTIGGTVRATAKEQTRREIAAFIAEGSMTPEQGERLMRAGKDSKTA